MLSAAVIVFREVLEAALIISIVMAATRNVMNRGMWITSGIATGLLGACVVALFTDAIAFSLDGVGQEAFNAGILLTAVLMLGWHNVWMAQHGKQLASRMSNLGRTVSSGDAPLYALAAAISLAVLREGAEVVLFLHGIAASGESPHNLLLGSSAGVMAGILAGYLLYSGLVRVPVKQFFSVTSWMILLLSCGLAASAANYLEQGGWLPAMGYAIWDTSSWISEQSLTGQLLHTLVGYQASPSGIQITFYVVTLIVTLTLMKTVSSLNSKSEQAAVAN